MTKLLGYTIAEFVWIVNTHYRKLCKTIKYDFEKRFNIDKCSAE